MLPPPPSSTLFPYTTLFRSRAQPRLPIARCILRAKPRVRCSPFPTSAAATHRSLRSAGERSEEHTSELQSRGHLVCRLLLEKKKNKHKHHYTRYAIYILLRH